MKAIGKLLLALAFCFVLTAPAYSHTQLSGSKPVDQAVLDESPDEIVLTFTEAVRLTAVAIESGSERRSLEVKITDAATEFTVSLLTELGPGEYVVEWRALSEDTHVISGEIRFTIAS